MHSGFEKPFIRIHLLYHANQKAITPEGIQPEINSHGYQVSPHEIQQELTHLANEGYLTANGSQYSITTNGKGELQSVQQHLEPLYQEVKAESSI
jgi:DNA-binding PadR family transcriptional regulator